LLSPFPVESQLASIQLLQQVASHRFDLDLLVRGELEVRFREQIEDGQLLLIVPAESICGEVHFAQPHGFGGFLLPVNREYSRLPLMFIHELGQLHKHAARTARGIENLLVERLQDGDDQHDHRGRREELVTVLPFAHRELAEDVFVNVREGVPFDVRRDAVHRLEQLDQRGVLQPVVLLRQYSLGVRVLVFNGLAVAQRKPLEDNAEVMRWKRTGRG